MLSITQGIADEKSTNWKSKWEKLVQAAKEEGQVNLYMYNTNAHLLAGRFRSKYPQIKTVVFQGRGGMVAQRILAERRAKKFIADVSMEGFNSNYLVLHKRAGAFESIKSTLILSDRYFQGHCSATQATQKRGRVYGHGCS